MLSDMILDGILRPHDIDPLRRRERIGYKRITHPMVAVLAENENVRQHLEELGIESETPDEVNPIRIMHAVELSKIHTLLGKNEKLSLSGRPLLVTRTITTARLHILAGEEIIFLPYYFNPKGFYISYDNKLLAEHFRASLKFLSHHWNQVGQPIVPFLVREDMLVEGEDGVIAQLLHEIQAGKCNSLEVVTGALGQLLTTVDVERIDNLHNFEFQDLELKSENKCICGSLEDQEISLPLTSEELQRFEAEDDNS